MDIVQAGDDLIWELEECISILNSSGPSYKGISGAIRREAIAILEVKKEDAQERLKEDVKDELDEINRQIGERVTCVCSACADCW